MNRPQLAIAAGCAIIGATAASVLVPASADQVGGNEGSVTIKSPSVRPGQSTGTRVIFPRYTTAGNIEAGTSYLTVKKGSKTIAKSKTIVENLPKGTYTITTRVRYRYVTFRQQKVQVITEGADLNKIIGQYGNDQFPDGTQSVRSDCRITALPTATTFDASCAMTYLRSTRDAGSGEYTVEKQSLGSMPLSGTYEGATGRQDGNPEATLTIDPVVGGKVYAADLDEDDDFAGLRATKSFSMTFFNRKAGAFHSKSRTSTVKIDKTVP
jgi:hypothetical protein